MKGLPGLVQRAERPWIVLFLGIGLALPSLGLGFIVDDWFQRAVLTGMPGAADPGTPVWQALFTFMPGAGLNDRIRDLGVMPWWAAPDVRAAFFRPLSSFTHQLDFLLWRDSAALQHAHSLAWWGLGLYLVWGLYRKLLPTPAVAALAALFFAVEDAHAMVVGWIANRNALVCLVFGALAIRWHVDGRPVRAFLAAALGLCAGEASVGAFAYLFAWELCERRDPLLRRFLRLVPYGLLLVALRGVYATLGLGASGSGLYIDPGRTPLAFLVALVERWPLLALAQTVGVPIDPWLFGSRAVQIGASAGAAVVVVCIVLALRSLLRGAPRVGFLALGAALSAVPLCAAFPTDRLLVWPGLGAFGLLATLVHQAGGLTGEARPRRVSALLWLHLPIAAVCLPLRVLGVPVFGDVFTSAAVDLTYSPKLSEQTLVFVNAMELTVAYTSLARGDANVVRAERGMELLPVPQSVVQLTGQLSGSTITRLDETTLEVVPDGGFLATPMDRMFWHPDHPYVAGQRVAAPAMDVEVVEVVDGRPSRARMRFHHDLDGDRYHFVAVQDGAWVEWAVPAVGETTHLRASLLRPKWRVLDATMEVWPPG
jgi:hypothetical protein